MAIIDLKLKPSERELRWFGVLLGLFFGGVGGLVWWRLGANAASATLWAVGAGVCSLYYSVAPLRVPIYRGWLRLVYPIGWGVSHLALGGVYYLVLTPAGRIARLFGYDPLRRHFEPGSKSYWIAYDPGGRAERYFRPF